MTENGCGMHEQLRDVHKRMVRVGLAALAHANWHAHFTDYQSDCWPELSVIQAAHAAELLIKARIAQEHPLLIFEKIPKPDDDSDSLLTFEQLAQNGRTIQYSDLPSRLWAAAGVKIPAHEQFLEFGRLRNSIQHFSTSTEQDVSLQTTKFIYEVIDPFINDHWGLFAIDFNEDMEEQIYLVPCVIAREVRFRVSPGAAEVFEHMNINWPANETYRTDMEASFQALRKSATRS